MIRLPADSPKRIIKQMSTYNKSPTTRTLEIFHKCLCVSEEKPNKHVRTLNCKQHLSICHLKICLPVAWTLLWVVSSQLTSQNQIKSVQNYLSFTSNWVSITAWCPHNKILSVIQTTLVTMINLKLQQSPFPSDNQHAFDHHLCPAGGEFEPCLVWVENLKWKCDVFPAE